MIALCKENPFSILCDEGNDTDNKNFAILAHFWDDRLGKSVTCFLDMPVGNNATAENHFGLIDTCFEEKGISLV